MDIISIIIVNYNTKDHIIRLIESIYKYDKDINYEIIVVDNRSFDNIEEINSLFPEVKLLRNETNLGFGKASNVGAKESKGKYLLFLNPDILVTDNSIGKMFRFAEENPHISAFTGILCNDNHELLYSYNDFPDLLWEIKQAFGIFLDKTINEQKRKAEQSKGHPFEIDWAHGACLMIRKKDFDEILGFDENIFLYYEDVDIQKRLKLNLKLILCLPDAKFIHFERSSVRSDEGLKIYYFYMHYSKLYYMRKYFPLWKRLLVRLIYIFGFTSKIIMLPLRKKYRNERALMFSVYVLVIAIFLNLKNKV